ATPKNIVITTHYKPDADALGSSLGWAGYLKKLGHNVKVISPSDYPKFLHWIPGNDEVIIYNTQNTAEIEQAVKNADLLCYLDFSCYPRLEEIAPIFQSVNGSTKTLLVDHHINPSIQATFSYHNTKAAATAQLIYELISELGDKDKIDVSIGEALYAGILTDTGSFKHPSTTRRVHEIAGELIDIGVNTTKVHNRIYDCNSEQRLRFLGYVLSQKLVVLPEYRTAYITVTADELKRFHSQTGDTEGVVNYALSIEGIVLAAIMIDRGENIKLSFRSVGDFSVNDLAAEYFNGGGHKNAAGGTSYLSLEETEKKFLEIIKAKKDELLSIQM
ncbi:MAG: bifunctional oligoribonuclease/PAP phosphatase NrnA, partial [Raineya sp.]|nr:bifunctional oligoribonuclease/PAP phosphatase NrnA [Raineya sp.]